MNFSAIDTIEKLRNSVIEFLEGKRPQTFWVVGAIDEETIPIVKNLIKINKKGFITIEGQPGTCLDKISHVTKEYYVESQRAYVVGFLENSKVSKFIENINKNGKLLFYSERLDSTENNFTEKEIISDYILVTNEKGKTFNNDYTKFRIPTFPGQDNLSLVYKRSPKLAFLMKKNLTYFIIIRKEFCKTDLDEIILSLL